MDAPFSLDTLLKRYGPRRVRLEPVYKSMLEEAPNLVAPRSLQQTFSAAELPELAANWLNAETITLGLCTIGPDLESRVAALFRAEPTSAVVLDELGTRWVLTLGNQMYQDIRVAARAAGKHTSPSYRPGIGRWPLALQSELLSFLGADEIGVRLIDGMMAPQKSISMIVAVGAELSRKRHGAGAFGKSKQ
jgi:hypothetical protein